MSIISTKPSLLLIHVVHLFSLAAFGLDSLYPGQSISANQTLTSKNQIFQLGFFKPVVNNNGYHYYYIGTWYKKLPVQTIVWVANRENSASNTSELTLSLHGDLVIHDHDQGFTSTIWSQRSPSDFNSTKLVLEDSGNLVIRRISDPNSILWQSFDHPSDTWLPGAKVGLNKLSNRGQVYRSWFKDDDPSPGPFSFEMDPKKMNSINLMEEGIKHGACRVKEFSLSCALNFDWYTGEPDMLLPNHTKVSYVSNKNEAYFTYTVTDSSILARFTVNADTGFFTYLEWLEDSQVWMPSKFRVGDAYCDQFAVYNHKREGLHDCTSESLFQCHGGEREGFLLIHNATQAPTPEFSQEASPEGCRIACSKNCNCTAYTYRGGCQMWHENFFSVQYYPGMDLYIRLATTKRRKAKSRFNPAILGAAAAGSISLTILILFLLIWKRRSIKASHESNSSLMLIKYSDLRRATKNFSAKLGEGGFGWVYKGTLLNSSDSIAVKQLKAHHQEEKQFRAEVSTLGTIHHVNVLHLKGFCVEGTKRFLVYDYMPHGSLDKHIFEGSPSILDWRTRYRIALGIAKALAYLHEECRECIIHCDIKPENVLLDAAFHPKLADFGLAKLLGRDFSRVLTAMRGTRGYLAPEWISGTAITAKADVYSYGMMLFEIISGRRNWSITVNGENDYFPLQVMQKLICGEEVQSLLDSKLEGNANTEELLKVCRVAGWCIQDNEKDRPSMMRVVQILEGVSEVATPPMPRLLLYIGDVPYL